MDLSGKTAIVTGAAVGLGRAYAQALADVGVNLAVCDLRDEVHDLVNELATPTKAWQGNVADPNHVKTVVDGAKDHFGQIDILINNAGVWGGSFAKDNLDKSIEDYELLIGTNLKGEYLFGRAVIPILIEQRHGGEIVNIATDHMVTCGAPWQVCPSASSCPWGDSPRATGGGDTMDLYDASKWALNGLLYGWAKALAPHGIRVNQFCMGATDSNMLRSFHNFKPSPEEEASWMRAEDNARVLIEMLEEGPQGRNAQNINFCVGRPVKLEPPLEQIYVRPHQVQLSKES
ncbi:MAG: SDR family NAD(P)-dependent oxidoreductase [Pseudomonadales bacterium]|nr:SDR family NAD(P)-dependent oxidoreductase [Pseudomonadales bacterium]